MHQVLVIISALVVAFFNYGVLQAYGVLFTATLDKFREGRAQTFLVHSVLVGMSLGAGVFGGYLIKRINLKVVFIAGSFLLPLGLIASFFATSVTFLVVSVGIVSGTCQILTVMLLSAIKGAFAASVDQDETAPVQSDVESTLSGVGISFTYVSAVVVLSSVIPERHKTTALSLQSVACGAPGVILPYLFTWLTVTYGLSGTFLIYGGLALHNLAIAILFSNITLQKPVRVKNVLKEDISAEKSIGTQTIQSVSKALKDTELSDTSTPSKDGVVNHVEDLNGTKHKLSPIEKLTPLSEAAQCSDAESVPDTKSSRGSNTITYIIFIVTSTFVLANVVGIQAICQDVGVYKGLSKEQTLSCIAAYSLGSTIGRFLPFVLQKLTDNPFISPIVASMSGVLGQMLVLITSHYYAILIGFALTGMSDGGTSSSAPIVIFKILNQESQAIGFGLMLTLIGILATGSGPLYGAMYDATNSYTVVLLVTASMFAVGILSFTTCFILFQPPLCCRKKVTGPGKVLHVYAIETPMP